MAKTSAAKRSELEGLQEEALQHEIDINDEDGNPLSAEALRARLVEHEEAAQEAAEGADEVPPESESTAPPAGRKGGPGPRPRGAKGSKARAASPNPDTLHRLKLPSPSSADFQLADRYDYPVAVPGGKPYRIAISINCLLGGGERPIGSVMLMTDDFASNKHEHLTPVV